MVFAFIISKSRKTTSPTQQPTMQQGRQTQLHRHLWRAIKWSTAFVVATLGLLNVIDQFWGRPWPTDPEIRFQNPLRESSYILPFALRDKSIWPMNNVMMTCSVNLYYFIDVHGLTGLLRDSEFNNQRLSIGRTTPTNYTCDASDYVRLADDYSLLLGFPTGQFLKSPPSNFRPPLKIVKMCLYFKGSYPLGSFTSSMYQWPAAPGLTQWIEGPIFPDLPNTAWIPPGSTIGAAWGLRGLMAGPGKYAPSALQCDRL
jgi:hypothetical protein